MNEFPVLPAGSVFRFSGVLYTLRDSSAKKITLCGVPEFMKGKAVYFCGPSGPQPDGKIGACGPTTSSRFDRYHDFFQNNGIFVTIGKGRRSAQVENDCFSGKHLYLVTYGGLGAFLGSCVKSYKTAAFPELGPEAIFELEVVDFPVIYACDTEGNTIFSRSF